MEKSKPQSQVEIATEEEWAMKRKMIKDRIKSSCNKDPIKFDEETELEGREDHEADYEKVPDGLAAPGSFSNRGWADAAEHPVLQAVVVDNPMSKHEFSSSGSLPVASPAAMPVAPPVNSHSFRVPPKLWQQVHLRRLRKKTQLPRIDIWARFMARLSDMPTGTVKRFRGTRYRRGMKGIVVCGYEISSQPALAVLDDVIRFKDGKTYEEDCPSEAYDESLVAKTVLENSEAARVKNWPQGVAFVAKLPSITQPTMERERQRNHIPKIVVPDDRVQFAMGLAELSYEEIMSS